MCLLQDDIDRPHERTASHQEILVEGAGVLGGGIFAHELLVVCLDDKCGRVF